MIQKLSLGKFLTSRAKLGRGADDIFTYVDRDLNTIYNAVQQSYEAVSNTASFGAISIANGIYGENIVANSKVKSGPFWNSASNRPKTLHECLSEFMGFISSNANDSSMSNSILAIQSRLGGALFTDGNVIVPENQSVNYRLTQNEQLLKQVIADVFNRNSKIGDNPNQTVYNSTIPTAKQTQEYSVFDLLVKLIDEHGGINNLGHRNLGSKVLLSSTDSATEFDHKKTIWCAPFGLIKESNNPSKTYFGSPMRNKLSVKSLFVNIDSNTLDDNSDVTLFINDIQTGYTVVIGKRTTGYKAISDIDLEINYGDKIQFRLRTGEGNMGHIALTNITLVTQEII